MHTVSHGKMDDYASDHRFAFALYKEIQNYASRYLTMIIETGQGGNRRFHGVHGQSKFVVTTGSFMTLDTFYGSHA